MARFNKLLVVFLFLGFVLSTTLVGFQAKRYPKDIVNERVLKDVYSLQQALQQFESNVDADAAQLRNDYAHVRATYKSIETYVVFRYPVIDKAINGGPVPSIETEIVILHKDDPHGLQVIEEILTNEVLDTQALRKELSHVKKQVALVLSSLKSQPLMGWEILEANHLALTRLMTLGLSGFDSPEFLLSLKDAQIVLEKLKSDLHPFGEYIEDNSLTDALQDQCTKAVNTLAESDDFDRFSRFEFYRDQLVPIQKQIRALHSKTGFEYYDEYSAVTRSTTRAPHLFDEDYLNPLFTLRGGAKKTSKAQIELGKILFYDPVLSGNFKRSCSSCHNPSLAFTDGEKTSIAFDMKGNLKRNSPTLINSAYQSNFFYDLKSPDMNDQIMHVFNDPTELNISRDELVERLKTSEDYRELFRKAFSTFEEPISIATVKSSLEMYVRSLKGLNSKFDRNIRGEASDFTAEETLGANLFFGKAACATCHFPPMFNGFVPPHYQETEGEILGVLEKPNSLVVDSDLGRYELYKLTYPEADYIKGMFKTSTIRNIELTAPYMHNGAYKTLEEVVDFYDHGGAAGINIAWPQQTLASDSLHLNAVEKASLVSFMKTLSDTSGLVQQTFELPELPQSYPNRTWGGEY